MTFKENPDILADLSTSNHRPGLVVGFAAETENLVKNATAKLARKKCDWIIANNVSRKTGIMGGETNTVQMITKDGVEAWPTMKKEEVAINLVEKISKHLESTAQ